MPENILILGESRIAGLIDDPVPPRDPNGDDDEEDEESNDQPVVREPEPDE
jgi:hypothetical protein